MDAYFRQQLGACAFLLQRMLANHLRNGYRKLLNASNYTFPEGPGALAFAANSSPVIVSRRVYTIAKPPFPKYLRGMVAYGRSVLNLLEKTAISGSVQ